MTRRNEDPKNEKNVRRFLAAGPILLDIDCDERSHILTRVLANSVSASVVIPSLSKSTCKTRELFFLRAGESTLYPRTEIPGLENISSLLRDYLFSSPDTKFQYVDTPWIVRPGE
jgi:hypothetical protein